MLNAVPQLELRLLLACSRLHGADAEAGQIRSMLQQGVDWSAFARCAVGHGLAAPAGQTLARVAADLVPEDILDALRTMVQQARGANRARFEELADVIDALGLSGVDAIAFKGPVLALRAYGDLGLREFRDLDFLVRDQDLPSTIATLRSMGYVRLGQLTEAQFAYIHRLQGQEIMFNEATGMALEPHTKLTSLKLAVDIDYEGLWRRAQHLDLNGRRLLLLAPEDDLIALAVHGGKEVWWNLKWVCDIAAFIAAHPSLDWDEVLERARRQGCLRMVLLATALAREYFQTEVPEQVVAAEHAIAAIDVLVRRISGALLQGNGLTGPPTSMSLSLDRLLLHDGLMRRTRYVAKTLLLPGPQHVAAVALPRPLRAAYVPVGLAHDMVALPLWRCYRRAARQLERWQGMLADSELALAVLPASSEGRVAVRQYGRARAEAKRELAANPNDAAAWHRLGDALVGLKRHKQAVACYDKVLAAAPYNTVVWKQRAAALAAAGGEGSDEAVADTVADDAHEWGVRAGRLFSTNRFAEAVEASDRALELDPGDIAAARVGIRARLFACDWRRRQQDLRQISDGLKAGKRFINPFFHRVMSGSEAEHLALARLWMRAQRRPEGRLWNGEPYRHDKMRIAYMSTDFRDHVVADMIVQCLEQHDRTRLELTGISLGPDDQSATRKRVASAFGRFIDARAMSDAQVARCIRELEIDVLVDLNGSSGENRAEILRYRAAPVQATYLGYPGTTAMPCVDYIIGDHTVIPEENRGYYSEQVVELPHSYMPNDRTRPIASKTPSRIEAGLPEAGFVFACHNHEHKLTPEMFDIWMRLLRAVDGSVLWLKSFNPSAVINLRREARARGVAAERLLFAPHVARSADHLARLRLADLFLDTLPYNAHATACDALWAGLPVLTCLGSSFPGRVAASLLRAIDMPELISASLDEYEALALALAQDPARLAALREKLARNRESQPLFDTIRTTRALEAAYTTMWQRSQAGLPPAAFRVDG
jgi:predicted O-linked N-acetylglucosamine transferase (SPINDLY family)